MAVPRLTRALGMVLGLRQRRPKEADTSMLAAPKLVSLALDQIAAENARRLLAVAVGAGCR